MHSLPHNFICLQAWRCFGVVRRGVLVLGGGFCLHSFRGGPPIKRKAKLVEERSKAQPFLNTSKIQC